MSLLRKEFTRSAAKNFPILFLIFLLLAACSQNLVESNDNNGDAEQFIIAPSETNPDITEGTGDYYVFQPSESAAQGRLFIFLPGSLVDPNIYQEIMRTGAENGYYSIGLSYQNDRTFTARCRNEGPDCQGNVSREVLEGQDFSDEIDVSRASGVEQRIVALIQFLQKQNLKRDWDQFIDGGVIQWNKIYIAGHSQGSNHAAYIGWHRPVARVGMFSGPRGIADENGPIASWLQDQRQTPASQFYGFGNINDNITNFSLMQAAWDAMNLSGVVISVDEAGAPFDNSHQLSTSVGGEGTFNGAHGSTCADSQTPQDGEGNPRFTPVWEYMLFP